MLIVKFYRDSENPKKFPGDYPAQSMEVDADTPIEAPWVKMEPEEYQAAISLYTEDVKAINNALDVKEQAEIEAAKQEAKTEVQDIEAHNEAVDKGTATTEQRLEVVDTLASLMAKYAPILEQLLQSQG